MAKDDYIEINGIQYLMSNLSMADITPCGDIGRSITLNNFVGGWKKSTYQFFVSTPIGPIERSLWETTAYHLITNAEETELYGWLQEYVVTSCAWLRSKKDIDSYALELHIGRIFDNPAWVGFIPFNTAHRPAALEGVELVQVTPPCCQKPGYVTKAQIDYGIPHSAYCPHCGRWFHL